MKKILILAACFISLAAFVYFYEIAGEESRKKAEELEQSLFRLEKDQITQIQIHSDQRDKLKLLKESEDWKLEDPIQTLADSETVSSFLTTVTGAKRDRSFEETALELSEFGLENPAERLILQAGDLTRELLIGHKDFSGSQVYVKFADSPAVFLTSDSLATVIDKEVDEWRNKDALRFERDSVDRIEILNPNGEKIVLSRSEDNWNLEQPYSESAEDSTVGSLLSSLEFAEIQRFMDELPSDLSAFGLDPPAITVRLREEGQEEWHQLQLGNLDDEENCYAQDMRRDMFFTLKKDLFDELSKDVWDYRDKDVVDIPADQISTVKVKGLADDLSVRREDFKWIIEQPEGLKDREALSYKFWYPIEDIAFTSIEEGAAGALSPEITVEVELREGGSRRFRFGQKGEDFVAVKSHTGRWGMISRESFDNLQFRAEDIVEQAVESTE